MGSIEAHVVPHHQLLLPAAPGGATRTGRALQRNEVSRRQLAGPRVTLFHQPPAAPRIPEGGERQTGWAQGRPASAPRHPPHTDRREPAPALAAGMRASPGSAPHPHGAGERVGACGREVIKAPGLHPSTDKNRAKCRMLGVPRGHPAWTPTRWSGPGFTKSELFMSTVYPSGLEAPNSRCSKR